MSLRPFIAPDLQPEDYWRGIVLFGRNVASYKFALAAALLELQPAEGELVRLEELAIPYTRHLRSHLGTAERQATSHQSRFLDACRAANRGDVTEEELVDTAVRLGFANVVDAFHVVAGAEVPRRFFTDERSSSRGIRVGEAFSELIEGRQVANLPNENQARWKLVETAWALGVSPSLLEVRHDGTDNQLFVVDGERRRRAITGAREALSGYQKGHCFFCFSSFSLLGNSPPDVDHFLPHSLMAGGMNVNLDSIWNLVLACPACNRGAGGKWNRIPSIRLLERLSRRNEFLITSHHPLRETLLAQTGRTAMARRGFLSTAHRQALERHIHQWDPPDENAARF